jgi:hypothetical protein
MLDEELFIGQSREGGVKCRADVRTSSRWRANGAVLDLAVASTLCAESYRIPLYRIGTTWFESLPPNEQANQALIALLRGLIAVEISACVVEMRIRGFNDQLGRPRVKV